MNTEIEQLKERIAQIEKRNKSVELNKAWETSKTRIITISIITYLAAVLFMNFINTKNILFGALVPVIGFYLSTQSLNIIKRIWITKIYNKENI